MSGALISVSGKFRILKGHFKWASMAHSSALVVGQSRQPVHRSIPEGLLASSFVAQTRHRESLLVCFRRLALEFLAFIPFLLRLYE